MSNDDLPDDVADYERRTGKSAMDTYRFHVAPKRKGCQHDCIPYKDHKILCIKCGQTWTMLT